MKKKIYISQVLTMFILLFMASSCGEDYLEVDHYDIVDPIVMFESEEGITKGLYGCYDALYGIQQGGKGGKDWHFKPHIQTANMPSLDCQAGGWDSNFNRYAWKADDTFFLSLWSQSYTAVDRVNRFLAQLAETDPTIFANGQATKDQIEAEARAIRAYNYYYLAINFGRIPMLETGETYTNTPDKPRAETVEETWQFIIADLEYTISKLDWKPLNNEGGRITKGMAKAYVAKAYMRIGDFGSAKAHLEDVVGSEEYQLEPVFGAIHSEGYRWGKESVWELAYPDFDYMSWGANNTYDAVWWPSMNMQWGSLYISHEWLGSLEDGDRRGEYSVLGYGETNPYTGQKMADDKFIPGENYLANNKCLKFWKRKQGGPNVFYSMSAILMRYSEVLLNLAECKFEGGGDGWAEIDQIRNRAWGNLEIGVPTEQLPARYPDNIARLEEENPAPTAQTFYVDYAATKGYSSPTWKVALLTERRHEFVAEYSFWYDVTRMGMVQEYLDIEYPIDGSDTHRTAEYNDNYAVFPIPYDEILTNGGISQADQNPGY